MIFELKIFFKRPVRTPNGLAMFRRAHVEAATLADAKRLLRNLWEAKNASVDFVEGDAARIQERSHYATVLTVAA